jgi:hypothetical protein
MVGFEEQVTDDLRRFVSARWAAPCETRYVATLVKFAAEPQTIIVGEPRGL